MKRVLTATCLAATFAVGLAAQSTGTAGTAGATAPQDAQRGGGPRTITGCLRAGDTAGTFMLTDVVMPMGGRRGADATAGGTTAGGTTAGGTTAGGTTAGGTTAGGTTAGTAGTVSAGAQAGQAMAPMSVMLVADSSVDLKAHVGHKVEVTGTMAGGRGRQSGDAGTTGTATGTTAGGTSTGGTATATGTGSTSGTGTGAGTGTGTGQGGGRGPRSMTVTSVRMISESCS